jgi:hypothetical protein
MQSLFFICICVSLIRINFCIKFGVYITAPGPISIAHFMNTSNQCMCLYVYVARKRLNKNITAAVNAHTATDTIVGDAVFCAVHVV